MTSSPEALLETNTFLSDRIVKVSYYPSHNFYQTYEFHIYHDLILLNSLKLATLSVTIITKLHVLKPSNFNAKISDFMLKLQIIRKYYQNSPYPTRREP